MCAFDSNYCICLTRTWIQVKSGCGFGQQTDHNENIRRFVDANSKYSKNAVNCNSSNVNNNDTYLTRVTRNLITLFSSLLHVCRTLIERNKKCIVTHCILFVVSFICFANSLNGDFVHDDLVAVISNRDVCGGQNSLLDVFNNDFWGKSMADSDSHKSYRPLTVLSFRLNMKISGEEECDSRIVAQTFHIVNVALHTIVVHLIAILVRSELHFSWNYTLLIGLYFAVHPIHTEAVSSIVGRADVMCCIFILISFLFHCRALSHRLFTEKTMLAMIISSISATMALLSKETGIAVLPICIVYYFFKASQRSYRLKRDVNENECNYAHQKQERHKCNLGYYLWLYGPLITPVITLIALLSFRIRMLHGSLPYFAEQDNPASFADCSLTRLLTYTYLIAFNAQLLLLPLNLSYDWQMGSIPLITSIFDTRNILTLLTFAVFAGALHALYKYTCIRGARTRNEICEQQCLTLAICFLVIPIIPASNLFVTVGFVVAERVLYVPSFGFGLLLIVGLRTLIRRRPTYGYLWKTAYLALIVVFAMKTFQRNWVWLSRESLFESGLRSVPQNAKMHYNYANLQKDSGNIEMAIHHYRIALSLWPNHESSHNNLGALLSDFHESEMHLKEALRINPFHPRAYFNLANIYSKKGLHWKAISLLKRSIELDPNFAEPYSSLASLYAEQRYFEDANILHLKALEIQPKNADLINNYGAFLQRTGNTEEAIKQYLRALHIQPMHSIAFNNLQQIQSKYLKRQGLNAI